VTRRAAVADTNVRVNAIALSLRMRRLAPHLDAGRQSQILLVWK